MTVPATSRAIPAAFLLIVCLVAMVGCKGDGRVKPDESPVTTPPGRGRVVPPVGGIYHTVAENETLESISRTYQQPVDVIRRLNGLSAGDTVQPGRRLYVPSVPPPMPSRLAPPPSPRPDATPTLKPYSGPKSAAMIPPVPGATAVRYRQTVDGVPSEGLVFSASSGDPVWAAQNGTVRMRSDKFFGLGKVVVIEHPGGIFSLYGHLADVVVDAGDKVKQGDAIGTAGNSGRAAKPQVHFRLYRRSGETFDPATVLRK